MPMKNPPHPGLSVRYDCIEAHDLTITKAAEILRCYPPDAQQFGQRQERHFRRHGNSAG
jgi:plasmid maintenance system antidote protein VapI